jgi:hypothetical protein
MDWWITPLKGDRGAAVKTGVYPALREQNFMFGGSTADWILGSAWLPGPDGESRVLFSARFGDARNVWQIAIDERTSQVASRPERLTFGTASEQAPTAAVLSSGGIRVVFASLSENFDIWSLPLDPNRVLVQGALRRLTQGEDSDTHPTLSLDGTKLAYLKGRTGPAPVQVKDLVTGKESTLATGANPLISPNGSKIAYSIPDSKEYTVPASGGDPELLCEDCSLATSWSHDETKLLEDGGLRRNMLSLIIPEQGKGIPIIRHPSYTLQKGRFSPDGRWIAFHVIPDPTTRRVFVAPFRDPSQVGAVPVEERDWIPITDGEGMERYAAWSPDANVLYFLSERDGFRCLRAQRLDPATKRPVGEPLDVYHFHHARQSLLNAGDPVFVSPTVAMDKVAFGLLETTGNIWMTELEAGAR